MVKKIKKLWIQKKRLNLKKMYFNKKLHNWIKKMMKLKKGLNFLQIDGAKV
jgi:hypothetical protein